METLDTFFNGNSRVIMKPAVKNIVSENFNVTRKIAHIVKRPEHLIGPLDIYCR
jgi:hypothetical protein